MKGNSRAQVKTGRGTVDAQRVASTPISSLPQTTPGLRRALGILYCQPPMGCGEFGAKMWPERPGTRGGVSSNGGGDYPAQMLLGRLRRLGWARVANSDGSSRWGLTTAGMKMCRPIRATR